MSINISISEQSISRILACWGKTPGDNNSAEQYHPALYHLIDVGQVARTLLSDEASFRWKNILSTTFGSPADQLVTWVPWALALHDVGKISAPFQAQDQKQADRLLGLGFAVAPRPDLYHTQIGQAFLRHEYDSKIWRSITQPIAQTIIDMTGGHHGIFVTPGDIQRNAMKLRREEPPGWCELRLQAANLLTEIFLSSPPPDWPNPINLSAAVMSLCGFTILCDWLGSNSIYFHPAAEIPLHEYLNRSAEIARASAENAGFLRSCRSKSPSTFGLLFSNITSPRPLQTAVDEIPGEVLAHPCLAIVEAPTGEGKTEAALALAHRLAAASGSDELYYALPTTATSNQMYTRVQAYLQERLGLPAQVKLVHSQAFLIEDEIAYKPLQNSQGDDVPEITMEWFSSKKQALLAPFGVGTIDQAELGALNVRHNALRLLGLAGKVVILDEVHAYDTYMSTIIEQLLRWLSVMGTSVILLSATLPQAHRSALIQAYGAEEIDGQSQRDYPCVWIGSKAGHFVSNPPAAQPDRLLQINPLQLHQHDPGQKAAWLLAQAQKGGCVCWITNTVGRAQAIFAALDEIAPAGLSRTLIHSRFPIAQRQHLEDEIRSKYGPENTERRPGIVVGTQVLEQSLDLDFDVMVSDLAPIDLLLQRAGRIHRHLRTHRPNEFRQPILHVYYHKNSEGELDLRTDQHIYAEYILRLTAQILENKACLHLPDDYRPLIEAVYTTVEPSGNNILFNAWKKLQKQQEEDRAQAQLRLLPSPHPRETFTGAIPKYTFQEDEDHSGWMVGRTRLGEETATVIPLERQGRLAICQGLADPLALDLSVDRRKQLALLRQSMKVSGGELVTAIRMAADPLPALFSKSALLKHALPLWFENGLARIQSGKRVFVLELNHRLGLVINTEKGELDA